MQVVMLDQQPIEANLLLRPDEPDFHLLEDFLLGGGRRTKARNRLVHPAFFSRATAGCPAESSNRLQLNSLTDSRNPPYRAGTAYSRRRVEVRAAGGDGEQRAPGMFG